jgi:hypothetical protein
MVGVNPDIYLKSLYIMSTTKRGTYGNENRLSYEDYDILRCYAAYFGGDSTFLVEYIAFMFRDRK